jgi:probable rRNA maturation factor
MVRKLEQPGSVHFHFEKAKVSLKNRTRLKKFIDKLVSQEKKRVVNLNYIFCRDKDLLKINQEHLNHDFYTDVITFDLSSSSREIFADIYISVDRVKENSKFVESSIREELHRVMFHALLHLCGYDDKTARQRNLMRRKEDFYLDLYFKRFT